MALFFLCFFIVAGCVGFLFADGIWGNAIRLINVVTAALLALNFFEPVAGWLDGMAPSYTYFWDFIALWAVFAASMGILKVLTDAASRVKVRFLKVVEQIVSPILALWIGWVMLCFTMVTLHTAPLPKNFLGFKPEQNTFLGMPTDRLMLGFAQRMSLGTFSRSPSANEAASEGNVFDPKGEFMLKYNSRRFELETNAEKTGALRTN